MSLSSRLTLLAVLTLALSACSSNQKSADNDSRRSLDPAKQLQAAERVQLQGNTISPRTQAEAHTALAMGYYERGQFDVAIEELKESQGFDNDYAMIYNGYGLVYSYMKEDAKARQNFERAIQLDPNNPEIRHNWGWFLCTSGHARESLSEFTRVATDSLYKTPEIAFTNAGRCALVAGDKAAARSNLQRALRAQPNYAPAAYTLAELDYNEGRLDEARSLIRVSMQTSNPTPDALFLGACIERKKNDKKAEESYISQLRNRYPKAEQTQKIAETGSCR